MTAANRPPLHASLVVWTGAAGLLVLPAIAMQLTREVRWDAGDFVVWGAMLAMAGGGIELLARRAPNWRYRAAATLAIATAFLLVWVDLAVGIIGSEGNEANLIHAGVLAVAVAGACRVRLRAGGMARAMAATAAAQVAVGAVALAFGLGTDGAAWPRDVIGATALFATLWLASAWLFRRAAA